MRQINRRTFLVGSGALATLSAAETVVGQAANPPQAEHPMAPPVESKMAYADLPPFTWEAGGLVFSFVFVGKRLRFRHLLPQGTLPAYDLPPATELAGLETSISCTGEDAADHHGAKFSGAVPGSRMVFLGKQESALQGGKRLILTQLDKELGLKVESFYQCYEDSNGGIPVVRRWTRLTNTSTVEIGIEYVSSAMLHNFASPTDFEEELAIHFAYNSWQAEAQWRRVRAKDVGLVQNGNFTVSGAMFSSVGSWPCQIFLPMAMVENTRTHVTSFWQIEHNGSWHCEIAQTADKTLYTYLGGPDAQHAQAWKSLAPGEMYQTVPVAIGCVKGGFEEAVVALTRYRRATRLAPRKDARECPVIFNDVVMLDGNQTTASEIPLIDAAADAGCEIFCMDVGWYTKPGENWWGPVGDWQVNQERFPGGIEKLLAYIRNKGMRPGIWIEPEVAGLNTDLSRKPDSWFFMRHGRRVIDHSRFHLDFRNPEVREYTDAVFDRLVRSYGIRYIKLDYNINALEGTEWRAESFGQGLLGHNRAFLTWLDALLTRYPDLTIEAVASGGMRMEYSTLSRAQLQSISDQDDYRKYASLTTGCSAAILAEQMGVWSQPLEHDSPEIASCNMVNAMLGRIHQSGFLPVLQKDSLAQVKDGIAVYKQDIRQHVPAFLPFYPLGMGDMTDASKPVALGMRAPGKTFLALWRLAAEERVHVPGMPAHLRLLYPQNLGIEVEAEGSGVTVVFPKSYMGCILTT